MLTHIGTQIIETQRLILRPFTYEGTLRDYFYMNDGYEGRMYYSILRDEYTE